jgi:DNA-binding NarL/FixJ family response regulator
MTRVLIVDDQEIIRQGLRSLLAVDPRFNVVGECQDGNEVLQRIGEVEPDVVIMDVRMPVMDGATATHGIRTVNGPPVLILTTFDDDETLASALRAGAAGFVIKSAPGEDILRAVEAVAAGDSWIDPRVAARVLAAYRDQPFRTRTDVSSLTDREMDVLRAVGRGLNNQEVALELFLGEATVKTHLGRILTKLNLRDRSAAIVFAHENGLVQEM